MLDIRRQDFSRPGLMLLGLVPVFLLATFVEASTIPLGDELPQLRGKRLSGRKIVLPDSVRGSNALLLLGFTYQSRHDVGAWAERFRRDFGSDTALAYFEIPVIGGAGRLARPFINRGMRRGTPRELHDHVITVYGGAGDWKRHVGYLERDVAYLLLLDPAGRLIWRANGPYGEAGYQELAQRVRQLRE
jgi:hypothetical protein